MNQKKSIANLVTDLQNENEKLQYLGKLCIKLSFLYDVFPVAKKGEKASKSIQSVACFWLGDIPPVASRIYERSN